MLTPVYIGPRRYDHLTSKHQCGVIWDDETMIDLITGRMKSIYQDSVLTFCRVHKRVYFKTPYDNTFIWMDGEIYYHDVGFHFTDHKWTRPVLWFPFGDIVNHPLTKAQLLIDFPRPPGMRMYRDLGGGLFQSETSEGEYVLWDVFQIEKVGVYLLRLPPLVTHHILSFLK
jgi:hypothetical protein